MRVEYICHACLLIDTGDLKIVTDPWFAGPAYCGQWHVFPKPVNTEALSSADVILISHGHEDHFHAPSLEKLPKAARVFYPFSWFGGAKEYLGDLGFQDVTEAVTFKRYELTKKTSVTYIANSHDNLIVVESGGEVLVNANDALHAYPNSVIDFYLKVLREKWPRVDTLFCGFGGASYFPNTINVDGKNDREIGAIREQLFAHNFCRVVAGLRPRAAKPFAADFALLAPAQRWINEVRFPRAGLAGYYHRHFGNQGQLTRIHEMYPGDTLEQMELHATSNYRNHLKGGRLDHLTDEQYGDEIAQLLQVSYISESEAELLGEEIKENVHERAKSFAAEALKDLSFSLQISDIAGDNFYNVAISRSDTRVNRAGNPAANSPLLLKTSSRILGYSFGSEWGGDALSIGYGCEIDILDRRAAESGLDRVCIVLLAQFPSARDYLRKDLGRALRYVVNQSPRRLWARRRFKAQEALNYNSSVWLLKRPSELRELYGLPGAENG